MRGWNYNRIRGWNRDCNSSSRRNDRDRPRSHREAHWADASGSVSEHYRASRVHEKQNQSEEHRRNVFRKLRPWIWWSQALGRGEQIHRQRAPRVRTFRFLLQLHRNRAHLTDSAHTLAHPPGLQKSNLCILLLPDLEKMWKTGCERLRWWRKSQNECRAEKLEKKKNVKFA